MGGGWVGWALSKVFFIVGIVLTLQSPLVYKLFLKRTYSDMQVFFEESYIQVLI